MLNLAIIISFTFPSTVVVFLELVFFRDAYRRLAGQARFTWKPSFYYAGGFWLGIVLFMALSGVAEDSLAIRAITIITLVGLMLSILIWGIIRLIVWGD